MRALPAGLRRAQGGGDGEGAVQARRKIRHRHPALDGFPARFAGDAHQPAHGLDGQVEPAFLRTRPRLPIGRNRTIDESGIHFAQLGIAQPQAVHHARPIVFDQHVCARRQLARQGQVSRVLQVQRHRPLVAVERGEVLAVAVGDGRPAAQRIAAFGVLDLDDVRAHVRQQHAAKRARRDVANLQHRDAGQCRTGCHV
ncbi:hypothetical protein D9M68_652060 [compost metagenome]